MEYKVVVDIPTIFSIEARDEQDAIEKIRTNLIQSNQIKPADNVKIFVAELKNN